MSQPRLIPSRFNPNRTLVIAVLVATIAIVVLGVALALWGSNLTKPPSASQSPQITDAQNLTVDSFNFFQNATGQTTCNVVVTNHGSSNASISVNVLIGQSANLSSGQPYPTRQTPVDSPSFSSSQNATLAAGETKTVPVVVNTPESFTVDQSMIFVSLDYV